jgi:hypothetical protein
MNWKGYGRNVLWPNFRYYPKIWLEGLKKTTKNLIQDSLMPKLPEYKVGVASTQLQCLVREMLRLIKRE